MKFFSCLWRLSTGTLDRLERLVELSRRREMVQDISCCVLSPYADGDCGPSTSVGHFLVFRLHTLS